jgi:hypothetical protein
MIEGGAMRHIIVTFAAVVMLTFATALPVASFGLTQVRLTCNDGTDITAEVDANTLQGLVQAVDAMALYPAGLTCALAQSPLLQALGGVAGAGELRGGFLVGGGRLLYPCPGNPAAQFWVNFAVSANTATAAAGDSSGGTMNFTIPDGQCVVGHLTSTPICLGIDTPGSPPPQGAWYAFLRSYVTETTGSFFAPFNGGVVATGWKDTGNPGEQTSPDRVAASGGGQCPADHGPDPDTAGVAILNGNITISLK